MGFYSAFMVADKIEVFSKSSKTDGENPPFHWESDGSGTFSIRQLSPEDVNFGTKIVVHLKSECAEFSDENNVRDIIKKYSSFVGSNIKLNGAKANELRPVWLMDPKVNIRYELIETTDRGKLFSSAALIMYTRKLSMA